MKGEETLVNRIPLGRSEGRRSRKAVMMLVDNPYMTGQAVATK